MTACMQFAAEALMSSQAHVECNACRVRFLPGSWLMAISLLLLVAAYTVLNMNAAAKGLHSPVASVSSLFQGRHQELQYAEKAM